jgi:hypothetical protein
MKRTLVLFSILCQLSFGAELTDLGQGLSYLRIHSVAESEVVLRKAISGAQALVLDLRYATADEASASLVKSAIAGRSTETPLFVLVSPATPAALVPVISGHSPALTLGAPGSTPAPKVVVRTDAAGDRRAYDALDAGTELSKLVTGKIEKERFDEASLVQEFKNGHDPVPPPLADPTAPKTEAAPKEAPVMPPTDRVLQRAIHLHRAMLAVRR